MQAPPPFPFWPLSPTGPKRLLGTEFEDKELQSLDTFKAALKARGFDYKSLQTGDPASLLLDLNNAGEQRLLRKVVNDWGVIYSLWKTSDAYVEARGERRQQMRHLLRYLFFWGHDYPGRNFWPLKVAVGLTLFRNENGRAGARRRLVRAESLVLRLASLLTKVAGELRICSEGNRTSLRETLLTVARECEAVLKEAKYFDTVPRPSRRLHTDEELQREEALRAEKLILRLVSMLERALACLDHAVYRVGPLDAHRARHLMRQAEALLLEIHPDAGPQPSYTPGTVMLFDAFLYVGRLFVGFWLIPLVLATGGHRRPETAIESGS